MKAMILAAGRGERMRPLSDRVPKPLLEVGGKPLVFRLVERLAGCGIVDIVVNVSHLGEQIEQALGHGEAFGVRIAYSREREALETAGGIATALPLLGPAPFVAVNADVFCDFDFSRLERAAAGLSPSGALAHLVLVDNPPHHPEGDFCLHLGTIAAHGLARLTFSGIGAYHPALFSAIAPGTRYPLTAVLREPIACGRVNGEHHEGTWFDVGTPERLDELRRRVGCGGGNF